jgi:MFS family permease
MLKTTNLIPIIAFLGFVGIVDTSFISPIISVYAESLGASKALAGLIAGLYSIVAIPCSIIMGMLIDKIGRKRGLIIALAADSLVFLLYLFAPNYFFLIFARILHAIFDSFIFPASIAIIGDFLMKRLGFSLATFWSFTAIAIVIASATAATLVRFFGFSSIFIILFIISLIALFIVSTTEIPTLYKSSIKLSSEIIRKNIRELSLAFLSLFALYFVNGTIVGSFGTSLTYFYPERIASAYVGYFMAIATISAIPLFYISSRIIQTKGLLFTFRLGLIFAVLTNIFLYLYIYIENNKIYLLKIANFDLIYLIGSFTLGISLGTLFFSSSYIPARLNGSGRGGGSGMVQGFSLLGIALGAPISGFILQYLGLGLQFLIAALPPLIILLITFILKYKDIKII